MELRIKFSAEVVISGDNIDEIRSKWENMPLFSEEADEKYGADFCEVLLVDDEDFNDLTHEFEYGEDEDEEDED
jgi:hypothetical protein